jgi:dihydrofolate reductase
MRRIHESTRVSLDEVIGDLQAWGMDYLDADAQKAATAQLSSNDAMLMGRNTYQALSTAWSTREGEFAETINGLLDEIRHSVHPIIVGTGTLFYRNAGKQTELECVGSEPLPSGVMVLTYRPAVGPHLGM